MEAQAQNACLAASIYKYVGSLRGFAVVPWHPDNKRAGLHWWWVALVPWKLSELTCRVQTTQHRWRIWQDSALTRKPVFSQAHISLDLAMKFHNFKSRMETPLNKKLQCYDSFLKRCRSTSQIKQTMTKTFLRSLNSNDTQTICWNN